MTLETGLKNVIFREHCSQIFTILSCADVISSGIEAEGPSARLGGWVGESKISDMTSGNVEMIKEHITIDYQAVRFGWALPGLQPGTLIDARPAARRRFEKRARPVKLNLIGSELLFKFSFSHSHVECNNAR